MGAKRFVLALCWLLVVAAPVVRAEEEPVTIRFWAVTGAIEDAEMFRDLAEEFEAETGVRVEVTPLSWGSYFTRYFTAMAAGEPPDVGMSNLSAPFDYGSVGGLVDLRSAFPDEIGELEASYYPGLINFGMVGDKLFGVPADVTTALVFYRTDTFERLGLDVPETWAEMKATIRAIEAEGMRFYYGWPRGEQYALPAFTLPFGVRRFESERLPDGTVRADVGWDEPSYQRGIRAAAEFWYMHENAGDDYASPKAVAWFRADSGPEAVPMMVDLSHYYARLRYLAPELDGKWSVAAFPGPEGHEARHVVGGMSYVLFRASEHQREAFEWVKFLNRLESQRFMVRHRLNRGDASVFTGPPIKAFWTDENLRLFDEPELEAYRDAALVLAQVIKDCETAESTHGEAEASQLEQTMLGRLKAAIIARFSSEASERGMSRVELVQAIARGELPELDADIDAWLRAEIERRWNENAPRGEAILRAAAEDYDRRFGDAVDDLASAETGRDALWYAEMVVAAGGLLAMGLVAGVPRLRKHWVSYAFIAIPVGLVAVFIVIPAATALYLSFTEYHPVLPLAQARWVGLRQYADIFTTGELYASLGRSAAYVLGSLPPIIVISLVLASAINAANKAKRLWRFLFFAPLVTSMISVALIFVQLLHATERGWINGTLIGLGLIRDPIRFLESSSWFLPSAVLLAVWGGLAFNILIYLAGLQQIPQSLYEAAEIDGATGPRKFLHVSLPGLKPQILFTIVMGLIGGFQVFETIYMLGGGTGYAGTKFGPNDSGMTMVPFVFRYGFEWFRMGRASAISYVLFAVILLFTLVQFRLFRTKEARS